MINSRFHIKFSQKFSKEDEVPLCAENGTAYGFLGKYRETLVPMCSRQCSCYRDNQCGCSMAEYHEDTGEFLIGKKCPLYQKAMVCLEHAKEIYRRLDILEKFQ